MISTWSDTNPANLIALSYLLNPTVKFQLVQDPNLPQIPQGFSDVFLFYPTPPLQNGLETAYDATT